MYHNPYQQLSGGKWIRVNFHTHAGTPDQPCGICSIEAVLEQYKKLGYGALCISNHDRHTDTTEQGTDDLYMIQGVEYSSSPHMLTLGINQTLHDLPHQEAIEKTAALGGFTILCHPNWIRKEYWTREQLDHLRGYAGLEVINMLIYRLQGSGLATDTWDYLLRQGKLAFGFGNDDMHILSDVGRSWTDIYVSGHGYVPIRKAVDSGVFTASTGLRLKSLTLKNGVIHVQAGFLTETYVQDFTYRFVTENGVFGDFRGESAEFALNGANYVRVEAVGENGVMLFTQPVYKKSAFRTP